jgi:pimeloyl-ACP methyl ester carboxylesterase
VPDTYPAEILPAGLRSRFVRNNNGLEMHILEAGFEEAGRPVVLMLHGFPELAFSWRKVMPALAAAGYHVVAPDQRGYGRTVGWDASYEGDLGSFRMLNLVRDEVGLMSALGIREVAAVVGHDAGAGVAGWCALIRPDIFRSVAMMSAPFGGPTAFPFATADQAGAPTPAGRSIHDDLAALDPPRKHYQWYYSTPQANEEMWHAPQGIHDFMRGYYHHKSADWKQNRPYPLGGWVASEIAKMPTYYVMRLDQTMAETVADEMPTPAEIEACAWLPDSELRVYAEEYGRKGFQGGLQWYRCGTSGLNGADLALYSGRAIDVPSMFVAGAQDWGIYQRPGSIERMQREACSDFRGLHLIKGAGHWVQQEQPDDVSRLLLEFLAG